MGVVSIQIAADLTAAAAPPPAPPVSIETLKDQLAAEQARAAGLQKQLEDLLGVTGQLTVALDSTQSQVTDDGLTADELRKRLKAAESKLSAVNKLLRKAEARLAALGQSDKSTSSGTKPTTGGAAPGATRAPTPKPAAPATPFSLAVQLAGGGVQATWTTMRSIRFLRLRAGPFDRQRDPLPTRGPRHADRADHDTVRELGDRRSRPFGQPLVPRLLPESA